MTEPRVRNNLLAERRRRGWSQSQVAELAGISRQSYSAIESGEAVPSTEIALRLARGFGRPVEELFRLVDERTEGARARWAGIGGPSAGRRVRLARVAGELLALGGGAGERPNREADGVILGSTGSEVRVGLFPERPPEAALVVVGCDPAFGVVADALRREREVEVVWMPRSSREALEAVARGEAHVAGAHLRDPAGGFNARWVTEIVPFPCTRVVFAEWEQGILLPAGNPQGIGSVEDLTRESVRYLNREAGSGSRALLDESLRAAGIAAREIHGYDSSARGHFAVGEAIASGLADAGIAIRAAAAAFDLDILPLAVESYELVIPNHFLDLPAIGALLDTLRRPGVSRQVAALGGYDVSRMGSPA